VALRARPRARDHAAVAVINRVLFAHRIAAPTLTSTRSPTAQALVIRAGWGEGEQVADGHWLHARELPASDLQRSPPARRRASALRPQERLAELLGRAARRCVCEELTLRARLDLDHGRLAHAAIELDRRYARAVPELRAEGPPRTSPRASTSSTSSCGPAASSRAGAGRDARRGALAPTIARTDVAGAIALERLEAALRARTAPAGSRRSGAQMDPTTTAIGTWSGGRFMHFGEPLSDERLTALLRPGDGIDTVITADAYGAGEADRCSAARSRASSATATA
jgi:hypothetical protein